MLSLNLLLPFVSEEFKEQVPNTLWLVTSDDLESMYGGPITLLCDGKSRENVEEDHHGKQRIIVVRSALW